MRAPRSLKEPVVLYVHVLELVKQFHAVGESEVGLLHGCAPEPAAETVVGDGDVNELDGEGGVHLLVYLFIKKLF